jgi:hypothetical protein
MRQIIKQLPGCLFVFLIGACSSFTDSYLVSKTNEAYYNLQKYGVKSIGCKVEIEEQSEFLKMIRDIAPAEDVDSIPECMAFSACVTVDGEVDIRLVSDIETNIEKLDNALRLTSEGAEKVLGFFFTIWHGLMFEPVLSDLDLPLDQPYTIIPVSNGNIVSYIIDGTRIEMTLEKKWECSEVRIDDGHQKINIKPKLSDSEKGYLLTSYNLKIDNSFVSDDRIEYEKISGYYLPIRLHTTARFDGKRQEITFLLSDHVIEK